MGTVRKGIEGELKTAHYYEARGWLVGSRRHTGGAGDLICVRATPNWLGSGEGLRSHEVHLVEVKKRVDLWQGFRRTDRILLKQEAEKIGATPLVAWIKPRAREIIFLGPEDWPK
jgi:hypothetical protein